ADPAEDAVRKRWGPVRLRGRRLHCSAMHDNHLAAGFVGLHHAMRLTNLLEAKDPGWLRLELTLRDLLCDVLQGHVRERKPRCPEDEAAEEGEIDTTRHLQQRVEIRDRRKTAQPTGKAGASTPTEHVEAVENGAVADEIEHGVELLCFRDALGEV